MTTIVVLSLFLMEIMLGETSKGKDGLSEYIATSIVSMNEKIKSRNSLNKYDSKGYRDQYKVTSTPVIMSEGCFFPVAAENTFYGHCTLQEHEYKKESSHFYFVMLSTSPRRPDTWRQFYYILTNSCQGYSQASYFKMKASLFECLAHFISG